MERMRPSGLGALAWLWQGLGPSGHACGGGFLSAPWRLCAHTASAWSAGIAPATHTRDFTSNASGADGGSTSGGGGGSGSNDSGSGTHTTASTSTSANSSGEAPPGGAPPHRHRMHPHPEAMQASPTPEQALRSSAAARALRAIGRHREANRSAAASSSGGGNPGGGESLPGPPLMAVMGAMAGVLRGLGSAGLGPATFGLQALARQHEEQRVVDHPAGGTALPGGPATQAEAERLLDAMELAHGAYRRSAAALAATTCLRVQHVRVWRPQGGRLQPGYFVAVDHPGRRVVWGIRGTRVFADLVTDLAMAAHPLPLAGADDGAAHWGMTHAAHWLLQQEAQHVGALLRSLRPSGAYRLELVGHSMGGSVAALMAVMLREGMVEAARAANVPAHLVSCTAFAPPGVMSPSLAAACRPYVTSVVLNNDVVPRFNADSLALLREELLGVDWFAELQRTLMEHALNLSTSFGTMASQSGAAPPAAAGLLPLPLPLPLSLPLPLPSASSSATVAASAQQALSHGAVAVQQLSAAVMDSTAFRGAVAALDEWKARAMAAAGDQAEAAMRRQAELIRAWLLEVAAAANGGPQTVAQRQEQAERRREEQDVEQRWQEHQQHQQHLLKVEALRVAKAAAAALPDADSLAEKLRQNVEAAMSSFAAAATASRDRFNASLPSLPQAHELPLVEPAAAAKAAKAAAAKAAAAAGASAAASAVATAVAATEAAVARGGRRAARASASGLLGESPAAGESDGAELVEEVAAIARHPKELPFLLPPGRILYIRPLETNTTTDSTAPATTGLASDSASSSSSINITTTTTTTTNNNNNNNSTVGGARTGNGTSNSNGNSSSSSGAPPKPPPAPYMVVELPEGTGFRRLVLGRGSFEEHHCRAYRRVLMQLALQL